MRLFTWRQWFFGPKSSRRLIFRFIFLIVWALLLLVVIWQPLPLAKRLFLRVLKSKRLKENPLCDESGENGENASWRCQFLVQFYRILIIIVCL